MSTLNFHWKQKSLKLDYANNSYLNWRSTCEKCLKAGSLNDLDYLLWGPEALKTIPTRSVFCVSFRVFNGISAFSIFQLVFSGVRTLAWSCLLLQFWSAWLAGCSQASSSPLFAAVASHWGGSEFKWERGRDGRVRYVNEGASFCSPNRNWETISFE